MPKKSIFNKIIGDKIELEKEPLGIERERDGYVALCRALDIAGNEARPNRIGQ